MMALATGNTTSIAMSILEHYQQWVQRLVRFVGEFRYNDCGCYRNIKKEEEECMNTPPYISAEEMP